MKINLSLKHVDIIVLDAYTSECVILSVNTKQTTLHFSIAINFWANLPENSRQEIFNKEANKRFN